MMYSSVALRTRCRGQIKTGHTLLEGGNNLIIFTCFLEGAAPPTVTHQRAHARAPRVRLRVICAAGFRRSSRGVEGALQIKLGA